MIANEHTFERMTHSRESSNFSYVGRRHPERGPTPLEPTLATVPPPTQSPFTATNSPFPHLQSNLPVQPRAGTYFHSRRKNKDEIEKLWLNEKNPRQAWLSWFPIIGILLGFGCTGLLVWDGLRQNQLPEYCQILDEDFSSGFNDRIWTKEAEVGGYGNGQFEETTVTDENVFIRDGQLVIRPTLQDEDLIYQNNVINLIKDGVCTADGMPWNDCVTSTNTTNGTIINPVKSGRVNSKKGATIRYGKIEVEAQIPSGDWLWPAIWMLPVNATYGPWPLSGEIDIMESRGNNHTYSMGGDNIVSSALHWGPDFAKDMWWRTNARQGALHTTYSSGYHKFGLVWTPDFLFTYIDTQLLQVLYTKFQKPFWARGDFPLSMPNGTAYEDPWTKTGNPSAPFDQPFYLILNVAVGGSNNWFQDGEDGKPWVNGAPNARTTFWNDREQWGKTWEEASGSKAAGEMRIRSVKMWQQKGFEGCE